MIKMQSRMLTAEEVLLFMIDCLLVAMDELSIFEYENGDVSEYGERIAYAQCLRWIQFWEKAEENGLDFDIAKKFPL